MNPRPGAGPRSLNDRQRLNWLRLIRTDNVGPATFRDLVNRFGSAEAALARLPDLVRAGGSARPAKICSEDEAQAELEGIARVGARLIALGEADYPPLLRMMDQPPPLVTVLGEPAVFALPPMAVVGARNASLSGIKLARSIASEIGREGYAVVSGLARGIDAAAHQGSLATGTVAVLAGGIDRPYPPENVELCREIAGSAGAVVTEMPLGWNRAPATSRAGTASSPACRTAFWSWRQPCARDR